MPKVNRKDFLQRLEEVRPGLSPREIVEQSSCFAFKDGWVHTYNEEVACKAPSGLPKEFKAACKADSLLQLLRKMTEEEITLKLTEKEIRILGNGRKGWVGCEHTILLPTDAVKPPEKWRRIPDGFGEAVETVAAFASTDEADFDFVCVNVRPGFVEATDRHQVARYHIDTGVEEGFLVRKDGVTGMAKLDLDLMGVDQTWLHFKRKSDGFAYSCRRYSAADYPDAGEIVATKGTVARFPKELVKAVEKAEIFSGENVDDNFLRIHLEPGKLVLAATGVTGGYEETKKVEYAGPALTFMIRPKMFSTLLDKSGRCLVSKSFRMKVRHENWVYVACLEKERKAAEPDGKEVG